MRTDVHARKQPALPKPQKHRNVFNRYAFLSRIAIIFSFTCLVIGCASLMHSLSPAARLKCVAGSPQQVPGYLLTRDPSLRPTSTAICEYGLSEFSQRLLLAMDADRDKLSAEYIEDIFGLPPMTAVVDDPRYASYLSIDTGPDWKVYINVGERFPNDDTGKRNFSSAPHPVALSPLRHASVDVTFNALQTQTKEVPCLKYRPFIDKAVLEKWTQIRGLGTDGAHPGPLYVSPKGVTLRMDFFDSQTGCTVHMSLSKNAR